MISALLSAMEFIAFCRPENSTLRQKSDAYGQFFFTKHSQVWFQLSLYSPMKILSVVGARPNFMKIAPIVRVLADKSNSIEHLLVHTGQHYDINMSQIFFDELELPQPHINLEAGSGSHAWQTAEVMQRFEPVLLEYKPDWVLVPGDVNSTLACALVCSKLGVKVAHLEAGLRSFDRSMPEEINRILTDQLSDLLLTPSQDADENLLKEGIAPEKLHFVSNIMINTLLRLLTKAKQRWEGLQNQFGMEKRFVLATLHRPSNVDNPETLRNIFQALTVIAQKETVLFPVHPRTRQRIQAMQTSKDESRIRMIDSLGYLDFLALQMNAALVLTDSGGVQEETSYLGIPCLTARPNTERSVTVQQGTNQLVESVYESLLLASESRLAPCNKRNQHSVPALWDGHTAERIVDLFTKQLSLSTVQDLKRLSPAMVFHRVTGPSVAAIPVQRRSGQRRRAVTGRVRSGSSCTGAVVRFFSPNGLLLIGPETGQYRPGGGQGQQGQQPFQPLGFDQIGLLPVKAVRFERGKQRFNTPALGILSHTVMGRIGTGHNQPFTRTEPLGSQIQPNTADLARGAQHAPLSHRQIAKQAPNWPLALVRTHRQIRFNATAKTNRTLFQVTPPVGSDKLPVGQQVRDARGAKRGAKSLHQRDPLVAIRVPRFVQGAPKQRDGDALIDHAQHQDIQLRFPQFPVAPIQTQHPAQLKARLRFAQGARSGLDAAWRVLTQWQHPGYRPYPRLIDLKAAQKALQANIVRTGFGARREHHRQTRQIDRANLQ